MQASLYVRRGPQSGALFPLYSEAITLVGRARSNHVVLLDRGVSANHCILAPARGGEGFLLIEARTRSGLAVNGEPFSKGHVTVADVLTVGPFELELVPTEQAVAKPKPLRPTSGGPARFEFGRPRRGVFLPLPSGSAMVVGRGPYAHIRVDHHLISEYHCLLALDPRDPRAMPLLIDLHSSNGTYVQRRAVHRKHVLPGDTVTLGRTVCEVRRLEVEEPAEPRPTPARRPARAQARAAPPARPRPSPAASAPAPGQPAPAPAPPTPAPTPTPPGPTPPRRPTPAPRATFVEQLAFLAGAPPRRLVPEEAPAKPPGPAPGSGPDFAPEPEPVPAAEPEPAPEPEAAIEGGVGVPDEDDAPATDLGSTPRIEPLPSPEPPRLAGRSATDRALVERPEAFRAYFGFRDEPFAHDHDPRFFFHSQCHWEAFTTLNRWVETGPPLAVLFGEHGSGKTFLTACLARRLGLISPRTVLVWPDRETARRNDLILEAVLAAAVKYGGSAEHGHSPIEVWHTLLAEVRRNDALFVFLIDDAHEMSRDNLRRLVELLEHPNLRHAARILLTGEEQLRDLVSAPPLADHLGITCYLSPMTAEDVAAYVEHRLRLAAEDDAEAPPLFSARALQLLATYSGGIPRLINNVADAALYYAYLQGARDVTPELLSTAVDQLTLADARPIHV